MGTSSGTTCSWPGCDELATCASGGRWRCGVHEEMYLRNVRQRERPVIKMRPVAEVSSAPTPDEGETSSGSKRLAARWMAWTEGVAERNRDWPERHRDALDRNYLERRQVNTEGTINGFEYKMSVEKLSRVDLRETVRREKILEREEREQRRDEWDREYLERKLNLMVKSGVVSADEIEDELGVDGIEGLSRVTLREVTNLLRQEQRAEFWTAIGQGVVTMAASVNTESNWQRNFNPKPTPESHPPGAGHRQAAYQPSQNASRSEPTCYICGMPGSASTASGWMCGLHAHGLL